MLVLLFLLISRLINRSGLRISHSKVSALFIFIYVCLQKWFANFLLKSNNGAIIKVKHLESGKRRDLPRFFISRFQVYIVVNQALLLSLSFKDILVVIGTSKNTFISKFNQEHDTNCITRKKIGEQEVNCRK